MWLIGDARMIEHRPGAAHPESPRRLEALHGALKGRAGTHWVDAPVATREQLERVHTVEHVAGIEGLRGRQEAIDPDTYASPGSVEAARRAAGAAVRGVEALAAGDTSHAFALVRPPGHHAEAARAMGFCLYNNVAVAAAHARSVGFERVLIVDWDVHHGNGTQEIFEARDDVMFFSVHQHPHYPGTGGAHEVGRGAGHGSTLNAPLPAGLGDGDYVAVFDELLRPAAERFAPDLVLVSAGFDAHRDDPLAHMEVSAEGYAALMGRVLDIANAHAGGRVLLTLEGGYDIAALARSAEACVDVLGGATPPDVGPPSDTGARIIGALREARADARVRP